MTEEISLIDQNIIKVQYSGLYKDEDLKNIEENDQKKLKVINKEGKEILFKHRISYSCIWGGNENTKLLTFIMLNPSTANHYKFDDTARNCYKIAKKNKFQGFEIVNLYTLRSPKIKYLNQNLQFQNDDRYIDHIKQTLEKSKNIVLAWGYHDKYFERKLELLNYFNEKKNDFELKCLMSEGYKFLHPASPAINKKGYNINSSNLTTAVLEEAIILLNQKIKKVKIKKKKN